MRKIYDLHTHSQASDGSLSPRELVKRAKAQGVEVLALTDHDTVAGLNEAQEEAKEQGIRLINGVEISTCWEKEDIHIVGLNIDPTHPPLLALLQQHDNFRNERASTIAEKLTKLGIENTLQEAKDLAKKNVSRLHFAQVLVARGVVKNEKQAFKHYLGQGKIAYVKTQWSDIPTAITHIHQAGGKAVLAHPLRYQLTKRKRKKLVADFALWGGNAIELTHNNECQYITTLAKEHNLTLSVGSDFHFPCAWREVGKCAKVEEREMFVLGGECS